MANAVCHFEIGAKDSKRAQAFYGKLFDWKITEHEGMDYGLVAPFGENSIGGGIGPTQPGAPAYVTFYVLVDDLQAYLTKAEKLGGKTVLPPTPIPGAGSCAMFADPEGVVIGLFKSL